MKVNQLEDVEPVRGAQLLDRRDEIRRVQAELGLLASALLPSPESTRRELDADSCRWRDLQLVRDLQQHVDLAELLEDDEDLMPELLPHQGEPHELFVFVAVADDDVVGHLGQAEDRLQLGLAATFEADAVRFAELENLL